jgi:hypothetical protein
MKATSQLKPADLINGVRRLFEIASAKTTLLERRWRTEDGAPVFTVAGKYSARGWTQWTQGFQYGNALLCFDLTGDMSLLKIGRDQTVTQMTEHLTNLGVHDHGFNNLSTYGQLRRLMLEGKIAQNDWELRYYEQALKTSGAVQAARWTTLPNGQGYIHSFNGPHSLFIDTLRTVRICGLAHVLGHSLFGEQDLKINLLARSLTHSSMAAHWNVYYGEGRDIYDTPELRGRTAHEAVFNPVSGTFRCPSSQQGYSAFSTWTRGLAWAILGFAEELEFVNSLAESEFGHSGVMSKPDAISMLTKAALATCDFYISQGTAADGICYWDTGAPNLYRLGEWRDSDADPYNPYEPVDSSASAIAAQGLIRLGVALGPEGQRYLQAGLAVANRLLDEPYLSTDAKHEGILLHSIYHRPNGWDYIPSNLVSPAGESSMWGDYHMLELGLLVSRMSEGNYYSFFSPASGSREMETLEMGTKGITQK